ncbi:MAG: hypothetical protein OXF93_23815 [Acidobacteria bacterium]|nr:hypothetical protein [Acidobacteriota bacterium]
MARRTLLATTALAALAGAAIGGGAAWLLLREPPPEPPTRHAVSIQVPADRDLLDVAVSADARRIAYTAIREGRARLYVRRLDRFDARAVPGTEGASQPFFSPDGETVGFFAEGLLKTVSLADDAPPPAVVSRLEGEPAGGAWAPGGTIVFGGPGRSGLREVPAGGGDPVALTTVDEAAEETAHGWPHVVDSRHVLYTVGRRGRDPRLALLDRETGESRALPLADGGGHFVEPSAIVFARRGEVFAAPLELEGGGRRGPPSPRPVLRGVAGRAVADRGLGRSRLAAARDGTLVFAPPGAADGDSHLVGVDADGRFEALDGVAARHQTPRIAPDGRRVAFSATTAVLRRDLWLLDLERGTRRQLTRDAGDNHSPLWTRDGAALTFASSRTGLQRIFRLGIRNAEIAGPLFGGDLRAPGSWSPDGRRLAFHEVHADRARDIWTWRRGGEPEPWLATGANERAPAFSPDGRWLAYVSDAEGDDGDQVYLQTFGDDAGPPLRVSPAGGTEPVWAKTGATLFYRRGRGLYRVGVGDDGSGRTAAGAPEHLFDGAFLADPLGNLPAYDVGGGPRLVMLRPAGRSDTIHLLGGWQSTVIASPDR